MVENGDDNRMSDDDRKPWNGRWKNSTNNVRNETPSMW